MVNLIFFFLLSAQRSEVVNADPRGGGWGGGGYLTFFQGRCCGASVQSGSHFSTGRRKDTSPSQFRLPLQSCSTRAAPRIGLADKPRCRHHVGPTSGAERSISIARLGRACPCTALPDPKPSWGLLGFLPPVDTWGLARPI